MKRTGKLFLFASSYLPCWIIFALSGLSFNVVNGKTIPVFTNLSIMGIVLTLIAIFTIYVFRRTYKFMTQDTTAHIIIKKISNGSSEIVSYLITSLTFLSTKTFSNFFDGKFNFDMIATIIFGIVIAAIYINSNLVVINPVLLIFGFKLYMIDYTTTKNLNTIIEGILVTRGGFEPENISPDLIFQKIDEGMFALAV